MRALVLVLALTACATVPRREATAEQPQPKTGAVSERLYIRVRDPDPSRYVILAHSAEITLAESGEAVVHATLMHGWEERLAEGGWTLLLKDAQGTEVRPVAQSWTVRRVQALGHRTWTGQDQPTDIAPERHPFDTFEAEITARFRVGPAKEVTLILRHPEEELRYAWRFRDGPVSVSHYGPRPPRDRDRSTERFLGAPAEPEEELDAHEIRQRETNDPTPPDPCHRNDCR